MTRRFHLSSYLVTPISIQIQVIVKRICHRSHQEPGVIACVQKRFFGFGFSAIPWLHFCFKMFQKWRKLGKSICGVLCAQWSGDSVKSAGKHTCSLVWNRAPNARRREIHLWVIKSRLVLTWGIAHVSGAFAVRILLFPNTESDFHHFVGVPGLRPRRRVIWICPILLVLRWRWWRRGIADWHIFADVRVPNCPFWRSSSRLSV